jgi:alkanesulfonate monooxygenase SsuD/methylene tetrahydromethanopterin reductase-like flavin-dependent oxidoreductase (luciferase family)
MQERVDALHDAVRASRRRGYPVWIGGHVAQVRELVPLADGWNVWGGDVSKFARAAKLVREVAPAATLTWGGLVSFREDVDRDDVASGSPAQVGEQLRAYAEAGADWIIVGPLDASNPQNATILGEQVKQYL